MLNPAHILEIALLLLVAFLIGAVVGSLARLAVARLAPAKPAAPSPVVVAEPPKAEEAPALVAAPVISEVVKTPTPAAPAEVPAPDFTEALLALAGDKPGSLASKIQMPSIAPLPTVALAKPVVTMAPARVAGETTSGQVVAHPRSVAARPRVVALGTGAEVIPFPLEKLAAEGPEAPLAVVAPNVPVLEPALPVVVVAQETPEPALRAEEAVVEIDSAVSVAVEIEPAAAAAAEVEAPATAAPVPAMDVLAVANVAAADTPAEPSPVVAEAVTLAEPAILPEPETAPEPEPAVTSVAAVAPPPDAEDDEAAAMRAIEGNWSPRRTASPRARKVDLPEASAEAAVLASAAAVAAATQAASLATAPESEAPGRPLGLPAPRLGAKDDLTHVIGILPIIETALNKLGLYHFDQVAELSDENAGWIENHLGIAGRIGREHWREQARELALAISGTKKAAGQQ